MNTETQKPAEEGDIITRRDYFAAHAPMTLDDAAAYVIHAHGGDKSKVTQGEVMLVLAQMRYAYAEEMMKVRLT